MAELLLSTYGEKLVCKCIGSLMHFSELFANNPMCEKNVTNALSLAKAFVDRMG